MFAPLPTALTRRPTLLLIGLCLIALLLRLWRLDAENLWLDEAFTWQFARESPDYIWGERWDQHPPLYYWLVHQFLQLGESEFVLRLPSVIAGTLSVPLLFGLGKRLVSPTVGWLAAAFLALSPVAVWYAQEARMYALASLCALGAGYAFVHLWQGQRRWLHLGFYVFWAALGLYTHYTVLLILLALNGLALATWLAHPKQWPPFPLLPWLLGQGLVMLLYAPWIPMLPGHWARIQNQSTYPLWVLTTIPALFAIAIGGGLALAGLVWLLRHSARFSPTQYPHLAWAAVTGLILVLAGLMVGTALNRGVTLTRQTLVFLPLLYLLLAGLLPYVMAGTVLARAFLIASLVVSLLNGVWLQKPRWAEAVRWIEAEATPNAVVVLSPPWLLSPYRYYATTDRTVVRVPAGQGERQMAQLEQPATQAWLILNEKEERWTDPRQQTRRWFRNTYPLVTEQSFGLLSVIGLTLPPEEP